MKCKKSILWNVQSGTSSSTWENYKYIKINGDKKATELFEFVANNSNVEWSHTKFDTGSNYITTAHQPHSESGGVDLVFKLRSDPTSVVREHSHSHPDDPNVIWWEPSGFIPGQTGDKQTAEWFAKYYPNATLKMYAVPTGEYIEYNDKEIKNKK